MALSLFHSGFIVSDSFRHAHYQSGNTPLVLVWKDENCSQYVLDTDNKGQVPDQQQVNMDLLGVTSYDKALGGISLH